MSKSLIVYFSRSGNNYVNGSIKNLKVGNTKIAANMIKDLSGADIYEIEPVVAYSEDYTQCTEEAKRDLKTNSRPTFKEPLDEIKEYGTIYLCYPNYWGTMPMHVWTFLEKYDFSGKKIMPLCTHEGSGLGRSESDIKKLCPKASVAQGLSIQGGSVNGAKRNIEKWI